MFCRYTYRNLHSLLLFMIFQLNTISKGSGWLRPKLLLRSLLSSRDTNTVQSVVSLQSNRFRGGFSSASVRVDETSRRISFITDIEGDRAYLSRFVNHSEVLCFRPCQPRTHSDDDFFPYSHCLEFRRPPLDSSGAVFSGDCFVFGGDVCDQGGSDLYVIRHLLDFKRRYPNSVYFVMGNRDINKMRIIQEMGEPGADIPSARGVYWLSGTGQMGDPAVGLGEAEFCAVTRLKWMLAKTMGSPRAFEYRRLELQAERVSLGCSDAVTDEEVVESYRKSCHPFGEMGRYLENANLTLRLGEALFLHGALPLTDDVLRGGDCVWDDLTFAMPWLGGSQSAIDAGVHSPNDWLNALNDFARENVNLWKLCLDGLNWSHEGGYHPNAGVPQWGRMIQYGMGRLPDGTRNPTVVYNSWSNDGMPRKFFRWNEGELDKRFVKATKEFFQRTGIRLICSGHQPQGDKPNPIRVEGFDRVEASWILSCDTSYSGDTRWHNLPNATRTRENIGRGAALSGRGDVAVSEVIIEQCCRSGRLTSVYCHGYLSDGTKYKSVDLIQDEGKQEQSTFTVGTLADGTIVPPPLGSRHEGAWWTRSKFEDGSVLLTAGHEYHCWNLLLEDQRERTFTANLQH